MKITQQSLKVLLGATANTADFELNCAQCGQDMHRYIDFKRSGQSTLPEDLRAVHQHLSVCPECTEIVTAILAAMDAAI